MLPNSLLLYAVLLMYQLSSSTVLAVQCYQCSNCDSDKLTDDQKIDCATYQSISDMMQTFCTKFGQITCPDMTILQGLNYGCIKMTDQQGVITRGCGTRSLCESFGGANECTGDLCCCNQGMFCNTTSHTRCFTPLTLSISVFMLVRALFNRWS